MHPIFSSILAVGTGGASVAATSAWRAASRSKMLRGDAQKQATILLKQAVQNEKAAARAKKLGQKWLYKVYMNQAANKRSDAAALMAVRPSPKAAFRRDSGPGASSGSGLVPSFDASEQTISTASTDEGAPPPTIPVESSAGSGAGPVVVGVLLLLGAAGAYAYSKRGKRSKPVAE